MPVGEMPPSVQKLRSSMATTALMSGCGIWSYGSSWRSVVPNRPMRVPLLE